MEHSVLQTHTSSQPLLRMYTLGPFAMEWVDETGQGTPIIYEHWQRKGAASLVVLLKFLLSQPHRFALYETMRIYLAKEEKPIQRLDNQLSGLRRQLCPPQQEINFLLTERGRHGEKSGYRLAEYPHIWVDADAATWNVEQAALLERFGDNAFPFWERAYRLFVRGTYLPDELLSPWSQARRALLYGHYRQCIHRYSQLLWERGACEEASFRLRTYWMTYPTDEDALRLLMKLLTEQGRYQEALEYYERLCTFLAQEGRTPNLLTQDLAKYVRVKPFQKARLSHSVSAGENPS